MSSFPEVFADGVGEISLVGGMVRIDWVSLESISRDSPSESGTVIRQRLVLPPEGFLRSFSAMEDLVKQLVEAGVIRRQGEGAGPTGSPSVAPRGGSPNFS